VLIPRSDEGHAELRWRYGYVWALGLMALCTGVGRYSKRKDWL